MFLAIQKACNIHNDAVCACKMEECSLPEEFKEKCTFCVWIKIEDEVHFPKFMKNLICTAVWMVNNYSIPNSIK